MQIWDLGGQANLRPSWAAYCKNTDAVVMVIDSTDRTRIGTTKVLSTFLTPYKSLASWMSSDNDLFLQNNTIFVYWAAHLNYEHNEENRSMGDTSQCVKCPCILQSGIICVH